MQPGQRIYGDYCECDDFSCPRKNDLVCSGKQKPLKKTRFYICTQDLIMVYVVVINDVNVKKIGQEMIVHVQQKTIVAL